MFPCLWYDIVGVSLSLVLLPLAILIGLDGVIKACTCSGGWAFCIVTFDI